MIKILTIAAATLATLATAKPIQINRALSVQNEVTVSGTVQTNAMQINGTLTGTAIEISATLEATTVRSDIVYTDVLSAKSGDTILVEGDLEMVGAASGNGPAPPVSFLATSVVIGGIKQWALVSSENFDDQNIGAWSRTGSTNNSPITTTTCGHPKDFFLGGACTLGSGIVTKTFTRLPAHKEVRIKATMNFIDRWRGEQAWIKLGGSYVWLDTVGQADPATDAASAVVARQLNGATGMKSVCGNEKYMELALGKLVDVTKRHDNDELTIEFGTSLGDQVDACEQSWGVDDVQVYVR
jgi:hypothetical protein